MLYALKLTPRAADMGRVAAGERHTATPIVGLLWATREK